MKYIMFEDHTGRKVPVIFPNSMVHVMVAEAMSPLVPMGRVISAGEAVIRVSHCGGDSETLGAFAAEDDATTINEYDYFYGLPNETGIKIP